MSELGDLLELVYNARNSFTTLQATVRVRRNQELWPEASRRYWASRGESRSVASQYPGATRAAPEVERFFRLWVQPPDRWRYETYRTGGTTRLMAVVNGHRWWIYLPQPPPQAPAVTTNIRPDQTIVVGPEYIRHQHREGSDIYDPSLLLLVLSLEPAGRAIHAGREAIRVRAWPKDDIDPQSPLAEMLWFGADEYELLVDAQRGTMLRVTAWMDGRELGIEEVTSVVFDEAIPEDLFEFTPPAGVRVHVLGSVIP